MDKTHTPGPWMWWTSCSWRRLGTADQSTLIMTPLRDSDGHPNLRFANGGSDGPDDRLIAAAPELLEALEAVVDAYNEPDKVSMIDSIGKAGDLIAKVNGQ